MSRLRDISRSQTVGCLPIEHSQRLCALTVFVQVFVRALNSPRPTERKRPDGRRTGTDRRPKRGMLVLTATASMLLAFALATLAYTKHVAVWHVMLLAFLLGTVTAFDAPARQAFVIEMVGREDLMNAIALNSAMFNGARIIGPWIAAEVLIVAGVAGCFFVNGVSY